MRGRMIFVVVAALGSVAACGGSDESTSAPSPSDGLRIASFDFAESTLLAELYAQAVETTGTPVVRLGAVGPREVVAPAIELGLVDLVPEYLGTALVRAGESVPDADPDVAHADLVERLRPLGITALEPSPAQDTNVVVVTAETAAAAGLAQISDLAAMAGEFRFGGPPECPERPLCLIGLDEVYGLRFAEFVAQRSQRFTAEALRRKEIDVGLMFSTDPALSPTDLVVLADDRQLQPAENIVPVVRIDAVARWGDGMTTTLDRLSSALTTAELQRLNALVDGGSDPEVVAHDWLASRGFVTSG